MGMIRTLGATLAIKGTPTPALLAAAGYTGTVVTAVSFSIKSGIATVVLGANNLPSNGYNGPTNSFQGNPQTPAGGQQVTLWGFSTATYFNGKTVSVIWNDALSGSFSFYFNHANVSSTNDAGSTAPCPFQHYRAIRLECSQALSTDLIYVGDLNVSSTRYMACLSLTGQLAIEIASDNIPADRVFIDTSGTANTDEVQVTLIY